MKVKVNIIKTRHILLTEAVTMSNLKAIASLVSEIWQATDRLTDTHMALSMLTFSKSTLKTNRKIKKG